MSKLLNREILKDLSNIHVDCQYAYQIGLQIVNSTNLTPEEYADLCVSFEQICEDISRELESIKKLIPAR
jgi:hypothetical protein